MTKEEIISALKEAAQSGEEYYIDDGIRQAMADYSEPRELVEPILEIIGTNPDVDFGMPGELVHFVEGFYKNGYEAMLIKSVRKNPTAHNIWMVHRCFNDFDNPMHETFADFIADLRQSETVSEDVKSKIDEFSW